jgi:hypothetical protein
LRQPPRCCPELPHQRIRGLAPMDVARQRRKTLPPQKPATPAPRPRLPKST